MKKQVFYIHGGDSFSKYENFLNDLRVTTIRNLPNVEKKPIWVDSLREDLREEYEVFMPTMPNKQNAKYEEWKIWFERHFEFLHDEVILLGWSLGGMFLAKYLSEVNPPIKIKAVYILGAPSGEYRGDNGVDCGDFLFDMSKLSNLTKITEKVNIWHSKDDFVVPYKEFNSYKKYIKEANFVDFEDKNHFLVEKLPELIESLKNNF